MKKSIVTILICIISCLVLAGCKDKGSDAAGPVNSLAPSQDDETGDEDTDKEENKKEKKEKKKNRVPVSGKVDKEDEDTDQEDIYEPVLEEVRDVINNGYDPDRNYDYISTGLMERVMYPGEDNLSEVIGYYYHDCNGDDIPELLIGENDEDETGSNPNDIAFIYSGFTISDGKPVCFLEGWARNRQHYMSDGRFFNSGSSGAMNSCFGEWHLSDDGTEQVWDDYYFTLEDAASGKLAIFHNTTGTEDLDDSERLRMSDSEFWDLEDGYAFKCEAIAWTPIGPRETGGRYIVNTMTDDELLDFEKKLNSIGYYGFLLSTYSDPRNIYWESVFYDGAGFDKYHGNPPDGVVAAYLKKTGDDEIYTDIMTISGKDVKNYVKETTGYDYSEMNHPLEWTYLKEYDLYLDQHGDTNRISVTLTGGQAEKGEYTITYIGNDGVEYCVTFKIEDGKYRFISNLPRWMVEDPTNGGDVDQTAITDGMIFPDSDSRRLTEDDLKGLDIGELRLARNEIYARHGRIFTSEDLMTHFGAMDWYFPSVEGSNFDEGILNEYERYNLDFIGEYEKKLKN